MPGRKRRREEDTTQERPGRGSGGASSGAQEDSGSGGASVGAQEDSRTCTIVPAGGGAGAASAAGAQESLSCWVCLDVQGRPTRSRRLELVRACACRGSSGW